MRNSAMWKVDWHLVVSLQKTWVSKTKMFPYGISLVDIKLREYNLKKASCENLPCVHVLCSHDQDALGAYPTSGGPCFWLKTFQMKDTRACFTTYYFSILMANPTVTIIFPILKLYNEIISHFNIKRLLLFWIIIISIIRMGKTKLPSAHNYSYYHIAFV